MNEVPAEARPLSRVRERDRVRARALRASSTDAERRLWSRLRDRRLSGYKFRRQHSIGDRFADFVCLEAQLVVELDGSQHFTLSGEVSDEGRTAEMAGLGFTVLRFDDRQALTETDAVVSAILAWLTTHHPHPSPLPQAGEGARQETTR